jgi:hypothetical protein
MLNCSGRRLVYRTDYLSKPVLILTFCVDDIVPFLPRSVNLSAFIAKQVVLTVCSKYYTYELDIWKLVKEDSTHFLFD